MQILLSMVFKFLHKQFQPYSHSAPQIKPLFPIIWTSVSQSKILLAKIMFMLFFSPATVYKILSYL